MPQAKKTTGDPSCAPSQQIGQVLLRMGEECADLALLCERLQLAVGDLVSAHSAPMDPGTVAALQEIDKLTQVLQALARLSTELAGNTKDPSFEVSGLAECIALESLASRILA